MILSEKLLSVMTAILATQNSRDTESMLQTLDRQFLELKGREPAQVKRHVLYTRCLTFPHYSYLGWRCYVHAHVDLCGLSLVYMHMYIMYNFVLCM